MTYKLLIYSIWVSNIEPRPDGAPSAERQRNPSVEWVILRNFAHLSEWFCNRSPNEKASCSAYLFAEFLENVRHYNMPFQSPSSAIPSLIFHSGLYVAEKGQNK